MGAATRSAPAQLQLNEGEGQTTSEENPTMQNPTATVSETTDICTTTGCVEHHADGDETLYHLASREAEAAWEASVLLFPGDKWRVYGELSDLRDLDPDHEPGLSLEAFEAFRAAYLRAVVRASELNATKDEADE